MPTIMQFSDNGLVGVLKRCCTTPTDRTRALTGLHRLSSQHAPHQGITGTDSPYKRGQVGEQVMYQEASSVMTKVSVWMLARMIGSRTAVVVPSTWKVRTLPPRC